MGGFMTFKADIYITVKAYDKDFQEGCNTGWGCGYVHIPEKHPFLIKLLSEDEPYLQPDRCPEEITWSEWDKDKEFYIIGFDTAHRHNGAHHDKEYVINQANEILGLVNSYTTQWAREEAKKEIERVTIKYSKYL